jgi:hypothetical protein
MSMSVTNIAWIRDHQHRPVLQLSLNGHAAHILSKQKLELTRRGLVKGLDFFASEWRAQADHRFIRDDLEPSLSEADTSPGATGTSSARDSARASAGRRQRGLAVGYRL